MIIKYYLKSKNQIKKEKTNLIVLYSNKSTHFQIIFYKALKGVISFNLVKIYLKVLKIKIYLNLFQNKI